MQDRFRGACPVLQSVVALVIGGNRCGHDQAIADKRIFPTVAEIFKEADKMEAFAAAKQTGNAIPTAAEAWEEVQGLVKEFYVYRKWEFSCQQVEKAARRFGIYELCTLESDAVNTARAQFMRIYDSIVSQGQENRQNQRALNAMNQKNLAMLTAGITKQLSECGGM